MLNKSKHKVPPELEAFCEAMAELLASDYLKNLDSEKDNVKKIKVLKELP